jgi:hypothetical protein
MSYKRRGKHRAQRSALSFRRRAGIVGLGILLLTGAFPVAANAQTQRTVTMVGQAWCDIGPAIPHLPDPCETVAVEVTLGGTTYTRIGTVDRGPIGSGSRGTFTINNVPVGGPFEVPTYRFSARSVNVQAPFHPVACTHSIPIYGPFVTGDTYKVLLGLGPWPIFAPCSTPLGTGVG